MTTKKLKSFKEFLAEDLDYVIVQLPAALVGEAALLNEGKWMPSGKSGWMQRVDAANPAIPLQRHVHVARSKHTSNKTQQAAWNEDGSRHDKKTFNDKVGSLDAARTIARAALNLGDDVILESLQKKELLLLEGSQVYHDAPVAALVLQGSISED
jgi:hypothetical protein